MEGGDRSSGCLIRAKQTSPDRAMATLSSSLQACPRLSLSGHCLSWQSISRQTMPIRPTPYRPIPCRTWPIPRYPIPGVPSQSIPC